MVIKLTHDQAFVLSDWLYEVMMKSDKLDAIVPDRAVWSGIYAISGTLEKSLVEIFMPDCAGRLEQARQRLLDAMGGDEDEEGEAAQGVSREPSGDDISNCPGYRRIPPDSPGRWTQHRPGLAVVRNAHGPT